MAPQHPALESAVTLSLVPLEHPHGLPSLSHPHPSPSTSDVSLLVLKNKTNQVNVKIELVVLSESLLSISSGRKREAPRSCTNGRILSEGI